VVGKYHIAAPVSLYDQGTIEAALYRMASKSSASLRVEGNSWLITFAPLEGTIGDIVGLFETELIDQSLRSRIEKQTAGLKTLILSNAFSRTGLVTSDGSGSSEA
jgi:His-Xaa-Ser system protein HxsD